MWETFKAEFKYIFKKRIRVIEYLVLLIIPFIYGFLYMNAYWAPFKHTDKLPIIVVNRDLGYTDSNSSKIQLGSILAKDMEDKQIHAGTQIYDIHVKDATDLYSSKTDEEIEEMVNSGKYSAALVIPKTFSSSLKSIRDDLQIDQIKTALGDKLKEFLVQSTTNGKFDITKAKYAAILGTLSQSNQDLVKQIIQNFKLSNIFKVVGTQFGNINNLQIENPNNIVFYNDYKNSYLAGEMTNFGAGLKDILIQIALTSGGSEIGTAVFNSISSYLQDSASAGESIIKYEPIGGDINTYGKGLSPYFISIALWAGVLVMTFMIKNERHIKNIGTIRHYFGKWLVWVLTGWAQATILLTAVTLQGIDLGVDQWQLFLWGYFVSMVFATIVQAVAYSIRYGDIGEFAVVILLVLQLISSSGTFPVEMQNIIFKILHPVAPFTYSVDGFREMLYQPNPLTIIENGLWLLLFPIALVPISLFINYRFDKRTAYKRRGKKYFKSFEIEIGDM